ncbi:uncharacterized protein PV06_05456 [Exophiala oligosperma]|uniref:Major facilitator superfamily (MFS) profile domain-containing protein n=1 Tax=Exophiala oligosperma TaxID=215243 RepID=A0A0D2APG1_9EURO|nr:uncharacterized protein PV06_05456 [Exophiala oligosperma]KIW41851.1 hypothetical protein PV06_05456 [Exophiala oligosperma]
MENNGGTTAISPTMELRPVVVEQHQMNDDPSTSTAVERTERVDNTLPPPIQPQEYPTGFHFILLTIGLILSIFLAALDQSIISTAIPRITDHFGTVKDVGWYGSAYSITNAAFQSTWGKAYKHFPLKPTFLLIIGVFELGNVISASARSSSMLIVGRIIAGTGGGGVMTGSFIIIALSTKPEYRAAYMGVLGVTFGCASVVGPLLGGVLTDGLGWTWCFWISLPIGFLAAAIMSVFLQVPAVAAPMRTNLKEKIVSLDLAGACLICGAMTCFVVATQQAGISVSWCSWQVITSLTGAAVLLTTFLGNEWYMGSRAMIQTHLLKRRTVLLNCVYAFFLAGLCFPLSYALPIQFQSVGNASAAQSGVRLIPLMLGVSVFTMVANGVLTFWRRYTPFLLVGAVAGTLGIGLVHTLDADAGNAFWVGYEIIISLGVGLALQVPMIANQAAVGFEDMAVVTSLTLFCENVGTALFIASTEAAFTNGLVSALARNAPAVRPEIVVHAGATEIRHVFGQQQQVLPGILLSYLQGCKTSHFVPIACGSSAVLVSMIQGVPGVVKEWNVRTSRPHVP